MSLFLRLFIRSLTFLQNNKILPQLLNHGKQTVPSSLRRDVWRPYFSIHFPETPAGAQAGLKAYHRLRELSVKRQLSPSPELVIATETDVQKAKDKYTPIEFHNRMKDHKIKNMPIKNQLLPKKLRARRLMDQKASSVADAAYVLGFINKELSPAEEYDAAIETRASKYQHLSSRAARRLDRIRTQETAKEKQIEARQETIKPRIGQLGLTPHTARRIALEHRGAVVEPRRGLESAVKGTTAISHQQSATNEFLQSTTTIDALLPGEQRPVEFNADKFRSRYVKSWREQNENLEDPAVELIEAAVKEEQAQVEARIADYDRRAAEAKATFAEGHQERNKSSRIVQVFWSDLRDATWAETWSSNVYHGELEQRAALKFAKTLVEHRATIDQEGNAITPDPKKIMVQGATTPHVFGTSNQIGWYETPSQLDEKRQKLRDSQLAQWHESKLERSREILEEFDSLYKKRESHEKALRRRPEYVASQQSQDGSELPVAQGVDENHRIRRSFTHIERNIAKIGDQISNMESIYPSLAQKVHDYIPWRRGLTTYMDLSLVKDELMKTEADQDLDNPKTLERLQQLDIQLAVHGEAYPELKELPASGKEYIRRVQEKHREVESLKEKLASFNQIEETSHIQENTPDIEKEIHHVQDRIQSYHEDAYKDRMNKIEEITLSLEETYDRDIIDDLRQRVYAEQENNEEQMAALDKKIRAREQSQLFHTDIPTQVEAQVTELDDKAREKGQELPPPPRKGVWGRLKGVFGR